MCPDDRRKIADEGNIVPPGREAATRKKSDRLGSNAEARRLIRDEVDVELAVCLYGMTNIEPSPGDCRSSIDESLLGEARPRSSRPYSRSR
jgi:hypothetical protein